MPSDASAVLEKQNLDNPELTEESTEYEFGGRHLIASYIDCDPDRLRSIRDLDRAMREAVTASGATVVKDSRHTFPGGGITNVYLLSESHASIHTYPEHNSCFVDIFTCGYVCDPTKFDEVLMEYFKPKTSSRRLTNRGVMNVDLT